MPRGFQLFAICALLGTVALTPGNARAAKVIPGSYERAAATVAAARAAQAATYAPVELRMAEETLALATAGLDKSRRDINIPRAIELAQVQAELARAKSLGAQLREDVATRTAEIDALERELLGTETRR